MLDLSTIFWQVLKRDLQIYIQRKSECFAVVLFYIIVIAMFPLVLGQLQLQILWLVPCIIWIAVMLTTILAQENLLKNDYQLGIFEQFSVSGYPCALLLFAKIVAHWLATALPLILITPLIALAFELPTTTILVLTLSLILGTPLLSLIAALAAGLTVTLSSGGILLAIILLPLYIPTLVLGASATILSLQALPCTAQLALLAAGSIVGLMLIPFALSAAIKASLR